MDVSLKEQDFKYVLQLVRSIASETAAVHAAAVDRDARFPIETITALKAAGVLSAPVAKKYGGMGCSLFELAQLCAALSQACGSSAMVLAMHFIQVGCIVRHGDDSAFFQGYMRELVAQQWLLASITSEVGTFGDTRSSMCAVQVQDGQFTLNKDATTGSYCDHADAILVTCRRNQDASPSDQVLVLVRNQDASLVRTSSWDTLGMRGTCSPGFRLESRGDAAQIVPGAFANAAALTMVPYSHILWSALWWGIAADAVAKAAQFVRGQARQTPGSVPPTATRLAEVSVQLQAMKYNWQAAAQAFDDSDGSAAGDDYLSGMGWALRLNNLKVSCSEAAPHIVHGALQIVGILGYKNDSPFSLGRHYRDALSGALMISNDRILAKSASMLLVHKDVT